MNSSKKGSSSTAYFKESEIFSSLQKLIDDQELLIQLKKFEGKYYQLFQQNDGSIKRKITNESSSPITIKNFNKEWQKIYEDCQFFFYNESLSYCYSNIKRCISKINEVFLKLSSPDSFPQEIKKKYSKNYDEYDNSNDEESNYERCITKFNKEFLEVKQVFNLKQYSQNFMSIFKKFLKKIPGYIITFQEANIDPSELSSLISTIQKKSDQISNFISSIEQTRIPSELYKLDEIIRQKTEESFNKSNENDADYEEPRNNFRKSENVKNRTNLSPPPRNEQKVSNSLRQTYNDSKNSRRDQIQLKNGRTITESELLSDIKSCSNRLKNISSSIDTKLDEEDGNGSNEFRSKKTIKFLQILQGQIDSESRFLNDIQKVEIIPEKVYADSELESERERNKMIFRILNKGQSALAEDIDAEKLNKLDKSQLISIILSLCLMIKESNNGEAENGEKNYRLKIPLELTFCHGTREEFKRLSKQYFESARYNEWAERENKKLSLSNAQLQRENEILSSQLNSKDNEYKLLNELRKIDERIQFINVALEQKLQTDSKVKRPTQSLETTELNGEVEDLVKRKKKLKSELKQLVPSQMLKEIESLNKANARLQCMIEARMRENEEMQKQILELSNRAVKANANGENQGNPYIDNEQNGGFDNRNEYDSQDEEFERNMSGKFARKGQFDNPQGRPQNSVGQFNQNGFDNQQQNFTNRTSPTKSNRASQFVDQPESFANRGSRPPQKFGRSGKFNEAEFEDQQESFTNRNSPIKSNRASQFNDQPPDFTNRNSSNKSNRVSQFDDQPQDFANRSSNSNSPLKSSSKFNRSSEYNDQQPQNFSNRNSSNKSNRVSQFDDQPPQNFSNRNSPLKSNSQKTAKTAKLNQSSSNISESYISRMNNSPNRNTLIDRNGGYEDDRPIKKSGLQGQNFANNRNENRYKNSRNELFEEEEDETVEDDQRNHRKSRAVDSEIKNSFGNRNRNVKAGNNGFDDDDDEDFYQNESEKKTKPRMRK